MREASDLMEKCSDDSSPSEAHEGGWEGGLRLICHNPPVRMQCTAIVIPSFSKVLIRKP
jgi:hypothetical protein